MVILANNSHYRVTLETDINAEGGSNPGGRVVRIHKKRTEQNITIPLSQWKKFNALVESAERTRERI